jgi:multidrug efflux pump subunit AcrA (membrane-fusion protein)
MRNRKRIIISAIIVIAIIAVIVFRIISNAPADQKRGTMLIVQVEKVHRMDLIDKINLNGDVTASQQATLYAKVSGTLDRTYVNMGDAVQRGTILALIDTVDSRKRSFKHKRHISTRNSITSGRKISSINISSPSRMSIMPRWF